MLGYIHSKDRITLRETLSDGVYKTADDRFWASESRKETSPDRAWVVQYLPQNMEGGQDVKIYLPSLKACEDMVLQLYIAEAQPLRSYVWWVPQVPMPSFIVEVPTIEEGLRLANTLADYDLFQLEHKVKPDFANMGGVMAYDPIGETWDIGTLHAEEELAEYREAVQEMYADQEAKRKAHNY